MAGQESEKWHISFGHDHTESVYGHGIQALFSVMTINRWLPFNTTHLPASRRKERGGEMNYYS